MTSYTLIDIGINLYHDSFEHDREAVIKRAVDSNVHHLVITGSCEASSQFALDLTESNPSRFSATAGIHPHHAKDVSNDTYTLLESLGTNPLLKAIGETGLDFYRNFSSPEKQEEVFIKHLELANKFNKPLFLHQRDAHTRFFDIIKSHRDDFDQAVVHCFTDTKQALHQYLDLDLHIGITGWICDDQRGAHLRPLLNDIPLNRLMLETDGPYLLPKNMKPKPSSRRNEPCNLPHIAHFVAEQMQCSVEKLSTETTNTAKKFFKIETI